MAAIPEKDTHERLSAHYREMQERSGGKIVTSSVDEFLTGLKDSGFLQCI